MRDFQQLKSISGRTDISGRTGGVKFMEGNWYTQHSHAGNNEYELWYGADGNEKEILYVGGDPYSAPAVLIIPEIGEQWELYYICRDYLGSITHIANADGTLKAEYSYDAWGRLRNPCSS